MNLRDLLLKKEELPILWQTTFCVPIYPRLLEEEIVLDREIALRVFEKATQEWFEDLTTYCNYPEAENRESFRRIFLTERPSIVEEFGIPKINNREWSANVRYNARGFVNIFSPGGANGGSLNFDPDQDMCQNLSHFEHGRRTLIRFPEEKAREFAIEREVQTDYVEVYTYAPHNIDTYPMALFLRNWAILYINEAIKEILHK